MQLRLCRRVRAASCLSIGQATLPKPLCCVQLLMPARVLVFFTRPQIAADGKRKIDSIYNIVGSAVFNLGAHVRTGGETEERK